MSTFRKNILGFGLRPDNTGDAFIEPASILGANGFFEHLVLVFNVTTSVHSFFGSFDVPQNYVGSANIIIQWTSIVTRGAIRWQFGYRSVGGDDSESLDQITAIETVEVTDGPPTTTDLRLTATLSLTDSNFSAGETVVFHLTRDGTDSNDLLAGAITAHSVLFEYADV